MLETFLYDDESSPEVNQVLVDARTTGSMILGALTLVAYDHLITLDNEVELMWKSRIHTTNFVYLWNRYFTLIVLICDASVMLNPYQSNAVCIRFFQSEAVTSTLILATVDFILVLRVWILYDKKRWLLYLLVPMIALEIVTMALVSHYTIASVKEYWALSWPLVGCYPHGNVPRYFAFYSVPVLVVSMVMFGMTCYKCGKTLLTHGRAQMPIYNLFLRDGVFWFVAIFMTFIPEVVIWARARQSLAELLIAPGLAVTSIIGSRVLMNIKALRPPKAPPATTVTSETRLNIGTTIELDTIDYPSRIPLATVGTVWLGSSRSIDIG
ncbi:hypothetical protein B0H16DRAFT_1698864 [Mycena metata]|uniref:DUF6533 domain-containing protein n=1 Tax=Mycena metata TaxID=1033252 RepID=A0AAD7HNG3_9AGAR|nr:hypothetical protein B0H16DRAFT_1698864 [Mycena metata]